MSNIENCGTWFFSYLSELFIDNDDIFNGYLAGKLKEDFCNIPKNTEVHMTMLTPTTFEIKYVSEKNMYNANKWKLENEDLTLFNDGCPYVTSKLISFNISYTELERTN